MIRAAQIEALGHGAAAVATRRCAEVLRRHWATRCRALGDAGLARLIALGVARAQGYGVTIEGDVLRYLNLMLALGHDFDRDPSLSWAAAFLTATELAPTTRIDQLCAYTSRVLARREAARP